MHTYAKHSQGHLVQKQVIRSSTVERLRAQSFFITSPRRQLYSVFKGRLFNDFIHILLDLDLSEEMEMTRTSWVLIITIWLILLLLLL